MQTPYSYLKMHVILCMVYGMLLKNTQRFEQTKDFNSPPKVFNMKMCIVLCDCSTCTSHPFLFSSICFWKIFISSTFINWYNEVKNLNLNHMDNVVVECGVYVNATF